MDEVRENYMNTLKEVADIGLSCGQLAAASVIYGLLASMKIGVEDAYCHHATEFSRAQLERMQASKGESTR